MKKEYRIKLFSESDTFARLLAIYAAKSNGGNYRSLEDLKIKCESFGAEYELENNTLILKSGEKVSLTIQEIDIFELDNDGGALAE